MYIKITSCGDTGGEIWNSRKRNRIFPRIHKQKYMNYLSTVDASDWYIFDINVSSVLVTNV